MNIDYPIIIDSLGSMDRAKEAFKAGEIIAYPTETFYGLCADPFNADAIRDLFLLKGRPANEPISLIISDRSMLDKLVKDVPKLAEELMDKYWPGPLTLVFEAAKSIDPLITAETGLIGIRISSSPVATKLAAALQSPITATSANPSGLTPAMSAEDVDKYFSGNIAVIINSSKDDDTGERRKSLGSTVVKITGDRLEILREGDIPSADFYKNS
jgi:L-threonylcarbamoyladenylate synthase